MVRRLSDPTGFRPASQQQSERTLRNEAEGRADIRLGGRTSLGVLFRNLIEDVDVPEELDEFRYTVGTELGYLINVARNSRVFVGYQVTFESFNANGTVPPGNSDAAFQVHIIGTGVRHELTPTLAIDAALGYNFTTSDAPQKDGHDGFTMNVILPKPSIGVRHLWVTCDALLLMGAQAMSLIDDTVSASGHHQSHREADGQAR